MTLYSYKAADNLAEKYASKPGGSVYLIPGSLVDGYICTAPGYKSAVIREIYISPYSSGVSIRFYNKLPNKYAKVIEMIESAETETDIQKYIKAFCA